MSDGYNFAQLNADIFALSEATDWETARKEWSLVAVRDVGEPQACLCGHYPIVEVCEIRNRLTGQATEVGNWCVKRFLGFRSDLIFSALKRITKDISKSLNADAIAFFKEGGLLNEWEYGFLGDTHRKRNLTAAQLDVRRRINRRIMNALNRRGIVGPR